MKQSRSSSEGEARKVSVAEEGSFSEEQELLWTLKDALDWEVVKKQEGTHSPWD